MSCNRSIRVIDIPVGATLTEPIKADWHSRSNLAYIVYDEPTKSVFLATKLKTLASHLNDVCARCPLEHVSTRGLYEAANKKFLHKMRFKVTRCHTESAHIAFEQALKSGVNRASIITEFAVTE